MIKKFAIGIDIGGSHISCAAFDIVENIILENTFFENKLDNHGSVENIVSCWGNTIQCAIDKVGIENVAGMGFAMPSPFNYVKGIPLFTGKNKKYENLFGLDLCSSLKKLLLLPDEFPIRFINDASAFAIGEDWLGQAKDTNKSISITLGTGLGSAFICNSIPVTSGDTVPSCGCVWHLPYEKGIADDYFSTRGLLNHYHSRTGKSYPSVKDLALAAQNDEITKEIFIDFGNRLFYFLKPWIANFGAEKIVIGGNISLAADLFLASMKNAMLKEGILSVSIDISELGEYASIIGSARLLDPLYWQKVKSIIGEM